MVFGEPLGPGISRLGAPVKVSAHPFWMDTTVALRLRTGLAIRVWTLLKEHLEEALPDRIAYRMGRTERGLLVDLWWN